MFKLFCIVVDTGKDMLLKYKRIVIDCQLFAINCVQPSVIVLLSFKKCKNLIDLFMNSHQFLQLLNKLGICTG